MGGHAGRKACGRSPSRRWGRATRPLRYSRAAVNLSRPAGLLFLGVAGAVKNGITSG
jgi:hypothetical protein